MRFDPFDPFDALSLAEGRRGSRLLMPGLRFDDKLSLELTMPSTVPPGRGLSASLPRHFVPGYYRAVPPGQKPFAHRSASH
jgi:hypothetical protein